MQSANDRNRVLIGRKNVSIASSDSVMSIGVPNTMVVERTD
jgi:hypothetical protein